MATSPFPVSMIFGEQNVRSLIFVCFAINFLISTAALATPPDIQMKMHPWGTFSPGSWKQVRVVAETLDNEGKVVSASKTESKSTLKRVEQDGITLLIEVVIEMAGKRFDADPQTIKQGFHGGLASQETIVTTLKPETLDIDGKSIPCKVKQFESDTPISKTTTKIYFSETVAPYVLKRTSMTTDLMTKKQISKTDIEVIALDMPYKVSAEIKNTAHIKSFHQHPNGTINTLSIVASDVPGGIVSHASKQQDSNGCLLRRSTLELIDYGLGNAPKRPGILRRRLRKALLKTQAPEESSN